jgi:nitronate monooxygenase
MSIDIVCRKLGIRIPIVQAPMAGGVTTPELVAAVSEAGALGSVGAPYYTAAEITRAAAEVRARTDKPFALNLFIPVPPQTTDEAIVARVRPVLNAMRADLGISLDPAPAAPRDDFDAQFEAVLAARPAVFSFTMGILAREKVAALHAQNAILIGTATTPDEGAALEDAGVDIVCAQGAEAGGHRGSFLVPTGEGLWGVLALTRELVRRVRVPVLAAGGIMDGHGIAAALVAGASGVQLGTAFLACPEAGTPPAHRAALRSEAARRTVITDAFSGRHGRAIKNRFTDALAPLALPPFPAFLGYTRDVRAAASKQDRADLMQLWAGQGAPLARELGAADLVTTLVRETNEALAAASALRLTSPSRGA